MFAGLGAAGYRQLSNVGDISDSVVDTAAAHSLTQYLAVGLADLEPNLEDFVILENEAAGQGAEEDLAAIGNTLAGLKAQAAEGSVFATDVDRLVRETTLLSADIEMPMESGRLASPRRKQVIDEISQHIDVVRGLYPHRQCGPGDCRHP